MRSVIERRAVDDGEYFGMVESLLAEGKEVLMAPKGNSMLPFIRSGRDNVALSRPARPVDVGDIVLARIGSRFVMHRVFAVQGSEITLMGDGNIGMKEHCKESDVIGIVTQVHREGGKVVKPGKGRLWRTLLPLRRYILAFYKRVIL